MGPKLIQHDNLDKAPGGSATHDSAPWTQPRMPIDWRTAGVLCCFLLLLLLIGYWLFGRDIKAWVQYGDGYGYVKVAFALLFGYAALIGVRRAILIEQRGYKVFVWNANAPQVIEQLIKVDQAYARRLFSHAAQLTLTNTQLAPEIEEIEEPEIITTVPMLPPSEWLTWFDTRPHGLLAAETGGGKSTTVKAVLKSRIERGELVYLIDPHSSDWFGLPSIGGGEDWAAVWFGMRVVIEEYTRRMQERDAYLKLNGHELPHDHFQRITILLDEANTACRRLSAAKRGEESKWEQFAEALGSGARKVGLSIQLLAQSANVEDIGLSGPMRQNFTRICLDAATTRLMIQREETDPQRKRELHEALIGVDYPATAVQRGQVVLLDRRGLDQVGTPANARAALWTAGYERAEQLMSESRRQLTQQPPPRSVVSASSKVTESARASVPVPNADAQTRQTVQTVLMSDRVRVYLKAYANQGLTRAQAREKMETRGLKFDNGLWTEVRKELGLD